jgi:iron complex outermembrane receptor protein
VTLDTESHTYLRYYGGSLRLDWDVAEGHRLTSITAYNRQLTDDARLDIDYTAMPANVNVLGFFSKTFTQELRYEHAFGERSRLLLGGYYFDSDRGNHGAHRIANGVVVVPTETDTNYESRALFANLSIRPTDKLELVAGIRYDETDGSNVTERLDLPPSPTNPFSSSLSSEEWLPKVSVSYFWTPDFMTYASYSKGFRSGGFNSSLALPEHQSYDSEETENYEIGGKSTLADGRVTLNLALFSIDDTNAQESQVVSGVGGAPVTVVLNGGTIRSQGFELELASRPTPQFQLNAAVSMAGAEIVQHPTAALVGTRPRARDRWHTSLDARYEWDIGADRTLFVRGDYTGFGGTRLSTSRQGYKQLVGAQVGIESGSFRAEAYVKNLFDEEYAHFYFVVPLLVSNSALLLPGEPRSYGLRLRYDF